MTIDMDTWTAALVAWTPPIQQAFVTYEFPNCHYEGDF